MTVFDYVRKEGEKKILTFFFFLLFYSWKKTSFNLQQGMMKVISAFA